MRMCSNLVCSYGSTEVGTVASAPAHLIADTPGAVGYVTPGVGNPEETKNAFRDGCFYPGDLGYLTRDGMLVVSGGRHKTRLNLGGAENSAVHTLLERD